MPQGLITRENVPFPKSIIIAAIVGVVIAIIIIACGGFSKDSNNTIIPVVFPLLEVLPRGNGTDNSLIVIKDPTTNNTEWIQSVDELLEPYLMPINKDAIVPCSSEQHPQADQLCAFNISEYGACTKANNYGYQRREPCIFLRLITDFDWLPEFYNDENSLPADMPAKLKTRISQLPLNQRNVVWVSCTGATPQDTANIKSIRYFPLRQGFPSYYYPSFNQIGYLHPLIAVQFANELDVFVNIECKAWAKNIFHNGENGKRMGVVNFDLLID